MKKQMVKAFCVCGLIVAMMLGCVPFAAFAGDSFEIFFGRDVVKMAMFETFPLEYTGVADGTTITWSSSDETILEIDETLQSAIARKAGTVTLTATAATGETDRVKITVLEPLVWHGEGTKTVLTNHTYAARTFALTVLQDGVYEIYSSDDMMLSATLYDEAGEIAALDMTTDLNNTFTIVQYLTANTTYYLYTYCDNVVNLGGATYDVTVKHSTRYANNSVYFVSDSIQAALGDTLFPNVVATPQQVKENDFYTLSSSDSSILEVDGPYVYAIGTGTATLIAKNTQTGATDSVVVTVSAPRELIRGTNPVSKIDPNVEMEAYIFTADINDTFCFRSKGAGYVYARLFDSNGNVKATTEVSIGEFYLNTPMKAGDMVIMYVLYLQKPQTLSLLVGKRSYPSVVSLSIPEEFCAKIDGDNYVVYNNSQVFLKSDFGKTIGCQAMDVTYSFSRTGILKDIGNGAYQVQQAGNLTATATTSNGLTDSISLAVIDCYLGDVNQDGLRNMVDAMTIYSGVSGKTTLTDTQTALTDYNGDNIVNMVDTFLIYGIISGKTPAEDTAPDIGEVDPTPGDNIEDDWA